MGQANTSTKPKFIGDIVKSTDFTKEEVLEWFRSFEQESDSGELNLEQFQNIYKQFFPNGDSTEFAEHVFRTYDVDKSGFIDFREFMFGVYVMSNGSLREKLEWAFRLFDRDNDGHVSKDEMLEIISAMYQMVGEKYLGTVVVDGLAARQRMEKIFAMVDKDGDVTLSLEEFQTAALKDKNMINLLQFQGGMRFPRRKSSCKSDFSSESCSM